MAYKHQVSTSEQATSILTPVEVDSAIPVVFGTAPINMTDLTNVNKLNYFANYTEAVQAMGFVPVNKTTGFYDFTLSESIDVFFNLYQVQPVIFVNVLDPEKHKTSVASETVAIVNRKGVLAKTGAIKSSVVITSAVLGTDYELIFNSNGELVISLTETGVITDTATVSYDYLDPSKVTPADIVGGVTVEGVASGLQLSDEIFPAFRRVGANFLAPKYSSDAQVISSLKARVKDLSGLFKAQALIDIPTSEVKLYSKAAQWQNDNNAIDPHLHSYWPLLSLAGTKYHMSLQAAAVMATVDSNNNDTPHKSPSNENYQADATVLEDGAEVRLTVPQAAEQLNGQGINTAINFIGGWKAWGNNTTAYPSNTDVKDRWIACRRMSNWLQNTCILTLWQEIDDPIDTKQIEQAVDTINMWLNSLTGQGSILGGRLEFLQSENPTISLMNGKTKYHLYYASPVPNEEIEVVFEYDPSYFDSLFAE